MEEVAPPPLCKYRFILYCKMAPMQQRRRLFKPERFYWSYFFCIATHPRSTRPGVVYILKKFPCMKRAVKQEFNNSDGNLGAVVVAAIGALPCDISNFAWCCRKVIKTDNELEGLNLPRPVQTNHKSCFSSLVTSTTFSKMVPTSLCILNFGNWYSIKKCLIC